MTLGPSSGSPRSPRLGRGNELPKAIEFFKMSGAGNDFVVVDNRRKLFEGDVSELVRRICSRGLSIGADGVLLIEKSIRANFRLVYYNADGSLASFCANGTRCAARFAFVNVIATGKMSIETGWGMIGADIEGEAVTLSLPNIDGLPLPQDIVLGDRTVSGFRFDVGVPHFVRFVDEDPSTVDVRNLGCEIRRHESLAPGGANVHFVRVISPHEGEIRSFERGVEDETLSCGSGVVAAALTGMKLGKFRPPVQLRTRSGLPLQVAGNVLEKGFSDVRLAGDARIVFKSHFSDETTSGFPLPALPAA